MYAILVKCSLNINLDWSALFKIYAYAHLATEVGLVLADIYIVYVNLVLCLRLKLKCDGRILWSLNYKCNIVLISLETMYCCSLY